MHITSFLALSFAFWTVSPVLCEVQDLTCEELASKMAPEIERLGLPHDGLEAGDAECSKLYTSLSFLLKSFQLHLDDLAQLHLKPVISQVPSEVKYHNLVNLTCTIAVKAESLVIPLKWEKLVGQDRRPISVAGTFEDSSIVAISPQDEIEPSSTLTIKVTEEWIGAEIRCGVEYRDTSEGAESLDTVTRWSRPHRLSVALSISEDPEDVDVKIDEKAKDYKMSCQFVGSKVPLDNPWIQGSHLLTMDPEKVVASREPPNAIEGFVQWTLHFLKVSKSSTLFGNYSCALKNARSKTASLLLAVPAKLTHFHVQNIASDGKKMLTVLKCQATGVPPPEIVWTDSRGNVDFDAVLSKEVDGTYTSLLTLESGEDVGTYSCTVKNAYSEYTHSFAAPSREPVATPAVVTEGEGIPIVGLPQVAAAVILVSAVLLGAICIVRKRHKLYEHFWRGKRNQKCELDSLDVCAQPWMKLVEQSH